ncbi:helix-turn-helix transcriptional regulator [Streptosporangium vulgare]|uniref:helix-turn-helix domain-containing protein n=1 Tax=Streptosporangium vulgare TaxID=46190 RepID=UPI0031D26B40
MRGLREERGISLSALARAAGVGKATLSGLENGTRNPTLDTLWAITTELGVPWRWPSAPRRRWTRAGAGGPGESPSSTGRPSRGRCSRFFEDEGVT